MTFSVEVKCNELVKIVSEWPSVLDKYPGIMGRISGKETKNSILLSDTGSGGKKGKSSFEHTLWKTKS